MLLLTARVHDGSLDTTGWAEAAADREATLAVYMGRDAADQIAQGLVSLGRDPNTPAVAIENAGSAQARLIPATLTGLGGKFGINAGEQAEKGGIVQQCVAHCGSLLAS